MKKFYDRVRGVVMGTPGYAKKVIRDLVQAQS